MRSRIFLLALASAAPMVIEPASAQSPYSYPWCSRQTYGGSATTTSCYFTSYGQCMTTISASAAGATKTQHIVGRGIRCRRRAAGAID